jgi:hypothetical protein
MKGKISPTLGQNMNWNIMFWFRKKQSLKLLNKPDSVLHDNMPVKSTVTYSLKRRTRN